MSSERIYIGNLPNDIRERDVEYFFRGYGRIIDIQLKRGFGFVVFDDYRDAEDAIYDLDGTKICGRRILVEKTKGKPRGKDEYHYEQSGRRKGGRLPKRTYYRVIIENLSLRVSWQDLKDYVSTVATSTFADAHKKYQNEGIVEFESYSDMKRTIEKLDKTKLKGNIIRVFEDPTTKRMRSRSRSHSFSRSRSRRCSRSRSTISSRSRSRSPSYRASIKTSRSPPVEPHVKTEYRTRSGSRRPRSPSVGCVRSRSPSPAARAKIKRRSFSRSRSRRCSRSRSTISSRSRSRSPSYRASIKTSRSPPVEPHVKTECRTRSGSRRPWSPSGSVRSRSPSPAARAKIKRCSFSRSRSRRCSRSRSTRRRSLSRSISRSRSLSGGRIKKQSSRSRSRSTSNSKTPQSANRFLSRSPSVGSRSRSRSVRRGRSESCLKSPNHDDNRYMSASPGSARVKKEKHSRSRSRSSSYCASVSRSRLPAITSRVKTENRLSISGSRSHSQIPGSAKRVRTRSPSVQSVKRFKHSPE